MMDLYPSVKQTEPMSPLLESSLYDSNTSARAGTTPLHSLSVTTTTIMDLDVKAEPDLKSEMQASPSQSPTLVADPSLSNFKSSPSRSPPPPPPAADVLKSSTPPVPASSKSSKKAVAASIQLISHLSIARKQAVKTFNEISDNNYQYKSLGRSREALESMTCDCAYEHGVDSPDSACGPYSDCINRLTQVECLPDDCRCRGYCQNQRFQRKQYANIEIVMTEMKGFGLRAEEALSKDDFIYEYVGDVVNPVSFKKRMRDYAAEGIEHFYFMMLQKDEFIDATKSGGIGRFANHSCNPNSYVAKWTVGDRVRMGIFAKRDIKQYEELTFNYNVDRYGHQAQECYCGEPNCIGFLGGKTQTDIATLDDLYLDALGITDEDDLMELKGTKKKKGKKIDDPDFMPTLKPIAEKEVPKVIQAIRQTTSRKVLIKLLTRIKITEDLAALRQIMRLRGYSVMTYVLEDNPTDSELISISLECMDAWPLLNQNKVQDSKVNIPVTACLSLEDEKIKELAAKLLGHWETLPVYTRIPKRVITDGELPIPMETEVVQTQTSTPTHSATRLPSQGIKRPRRTYEFNSTADVDNLAITMSWEADKKKRLNEQHEFMAKKMAQGMALQAVRAAAEAAIAQEAADIAAAKAEAEAAAEKAAKKKEKAAQKKALTPAEKEALREKRLLKLVGAVVVKCMSKYAKTFDRDSFKKYAKELTQLIADKEKKSSSYKEGRLEALSDEKVNKIKKFSKEYIAKVVRKLEKSGKRQSRSSTTASSNLSMGATPSTSTHTPNSHDDMDFGTPVADLGDSSMQEMSMSVEEAMGMDPDSGSDVDEEDSTEPLTTHPPGMSMGSISPTTPQTPTLAHVGFWDRGMDVDLDGSHDQGWCYPVDPRLRPPPH